MSPTLPNASTEQIATALRAGQPLNQIARDLHVDRARVRRIRNELGIAAFVPVEQTRTIEDKWKLFARPVDGGHMEWTGEHATGGTPLLTYKDKRWSAAAVAFRVRHHREPQGQVFAECGMRRCVAPDHVEDEPGRTKAREQLRYLTGGRERKARCVHGHDQAVHGGYETDGVAYCRECKRLAKHADREAVVS